MSQNLSNESTFAEGTKTKSADPSESQEVRNGIASSLAHIRDLTSSLKHQLQRTLKDINEINLQTRLLSFNAQIEATRAGNSGRAFSIVAGEMVRLSERTAGTASLMGERAARCITEMASTVDGIGLSIQGTRLSDLALTNIELVDRNLYERSCDVRWWATDSSLVDALTRADLPVRDNACKRLRTILDSYTVYYDLVVCDLKGSVVASGRDPQYHSIGSNQSRSVWFQMALATKDGSEFGFQSVHREPSLADGRFVLVYSCAIRERGEVQGKKIGVLGIVFNWEGLAQTVVNATQLSSLERGQTRVCLVDDQGLMLADTENQLTVEKLGLPDLAVLFSKSKGYQVADYRGCPHLIAHALSPGYETYSTGWLSVILQPLVLIERKP